MFGCHLGLQTTNCYKVSQLSWLERYTDNVEVGSSSLPETTWAGRKEDVLWTFLAKGPDGAQALSRKFIER